MMNVEQFWKLFLQQHHKDESLQFLESFHFDVTKESANHLLALVLSGKKQATASSLLVYNNDIIMPKVGDYSIVCDWEGNPHCIIETTNITILPYKEITYDICKREGEDDTLESWQENHKRFFTVEGKEMGYSFSEEMPVVFEDFKVVFKLQTIEELYPSEDC